jgi:hypothetical protein
MGDVHSNTSRECPECAVAGIAPDRMEAPIGGRSKADVVSTSMPVLEETSFRHALYRA